LAIYIISCSLKTYRYKLRECENYIEGEQQEMIDLYVKRGLSRESATRLVEILSKDPKIFVDVMMVEGSYNMSLEYVLLLCR
jgi:hypothetical protein